MPRPSGLSGAIGCRHSTIYPNTNSTVLNTNRATVYCFQSCGPLFSLPSNQVSSRGAL